MSETRFTLVIGNRNYSSWSMRAWLLMRELRIEFDERVLPLFSETFDREILRYSPARRVPVLLAGDLAIWDTIAIAEYLAEAFPDRAVWPARADHRARARSVCAEMHAGFGALRANMPMNVEARLAGRGWNLEVQADIDRIVAMWSGLRAAHAGSGPFLFGAYSAADAFYAPVVSRFETYGVALPPDCEAYRRAILETASMRDWTTAALEEKTFLAEDEPYRRARD
ncbi:MAG: glutathione S-transferase family protein [Burkholderiaceae bacterium]|nr:glutathione S-transferase family protein [Burkholderiaceae bacterium]